MPISDDFRQRLYSNLEAIAEHFGTPFHIYDEVGIRQTVRNLHTAFADLTFREFFAVKALPNPHILQILFDEGCGFDCSSIPELVLARQVGAGVDKIMFTSNNTSQHELEMAMGQGGAIINLDDISLLESLPEMPDLISFRVNLGSDMGNAIIGEPQQAKFGVPRHKIIEAYRLAQTKGIERFGLHTMAVSNERDADVHLASIKELVLIAQALDDELSLSLEFINIGGGLGIPYHPDDAPLDLDKLVQGIKQIWQSMGDTKLYMESGRYVTGSHGVLVTRAINKKDSYRQYIGVDANMSALMRPGMYGAYHHIDVLGKDSKDETHTVDVVGALCENNDKFAIQRALPPIDVSDLLIIQDTGAHGHAMGFNYNGRLRPQELLLRTDGTIERIRRAETLNDYFATLQFEKQELK